MPISRQPRHRITPTPRPKNLDEFIGMWVAVKDGKVIAASETSRALAYELHQLGSDRARGAVMEFVSPATASYVVGVG